MGVTESKQSQIQRITNEATIEVLNKISTVAATSNQQSNLFDFSNSSNNKISGVKQSNTSSINIQTVQQSAANGSLQASMENTIKTALSQASNALGYADNKSSVDAAIHNSIKANVTSETVSKILITGIQSNEIKGTNSSFNEVKNVSQSNMLQIAAKMTSEIVTAITASLEAKSGSQATGTQTVTNPLTEGIRSMSEVLKSLFKSGAMLWIIVIIAILIGGVSILFMFRGTISKIAEDKLKV
jgi:hypothetical protein